jgi:hypothetical protein
LEESLAQGLVQCLAYNTGFLSFNSFVDIAAPGKFTLKANSEFPIALAFKLNCRFKPTSMVETAYRLGRASDGKFLWHGNGLQRNHEYVESECVALTDCYQFEIRDSYGDGIIGPGGIVLTYDGATKFQGVDFGSGGYLWFGDNC